MKPAAPAVDPYSPTSFTVGSTSSTLSAIPLTGHTLKWYNSNGTLVNVNGSAPIPSTLISSLGITDYFVTQINDITLCESPTLKIQIIVLGVNVSTDTVICLGDTALLTANSINTSGSSWSYVWSTGNTTSTTMVNPVINTKYWVAISNGSNTWYDTVNVMVNKLYVAINQTDSILCAGDTSASIKVDVFDGYGSYQYSWNTGETIDSLYNISMGSYSVVVTDSIGCVADDIITILQPDTMTVNTQVTTNYNGFNVSCFGFSDGGAYISALGGTPNYNYSWSNGSTSDTLTGIPAGIYFVTTTDNNGCSNFDTVIISEPSPILISSSSLNNVFGNQIDCYGDSSGTAHVLLSGGTGNYNYLWSNGAVLDSLNNISAGTYWVVAQDGKACSVTDTIVLTQPVSPFITTGSLISNYNGYGVSCKGLNDGSIIVNAQGSNAPYSYLWSNGATTSMQAGLFEGMYTVIVLDSLGCESTTAINITAPNALSYSYVINDARCFNSYDGTAEIIPNGGVLPYQILWNDGSDSTYVDSLTSGYYTFSLQDENNCTIVDSIEIYEPADLLITVDTNQPTCVRINDGEINAFVTGGTYPYSYLVNSNSIVLPMDSVAAGSYVMTVVDSNSCRKSIAFDLNPLQPECFMIPNMYSPNYDGYNDEFRINHSSWSSYTIKIYNTIGQLMYLGNESSNWDGFTNGEPMPAGDYYYLLITDEGESIYGYVTLIR
jgi:gliding motility-associated-like protein